MGHIKMYKAAGELQVGDIVSITGYTRDISKVTDITQDNDGTVAVTTANGLKRSINVSKPMTIYQDIIETYIAMPLHTEAETPVGYKVIRVPGGWIYEKCGYSKVNAIFVPMPKQNPQ